MNYSWPFWWYLLIGGGLMLILAIITWGCFRFNARFRNFMSALWVTVDKPTATTARKASRDRDDTCSGGEGGVRTSSLLLRTP
jgi:hypothetical protein